MKKMMMGISLILMLTQCKKNDHHTDNRPACDKTVQLNSSYSQADTLQKILNKYTKLGVPGAVVAVYTPAEGWWAGAGGYAKVESKSSMEVCHLQYLQSVAKSYMAVGILRLYEQGKIQLDAPITDYLPEKYSNYIDKASTITVRMLLNHTSGVPEYTDVPAYIAFLLQNPTHVFSSEEYLEYIKETPSLFTPGSRFSYTNTNYHLLALLADAVTGDHAKLIDQSVFKPLGLQNTYYRNDAGYIKYPNLTDVYLDLEGTGNAFNATDMQKANMYSSKGDDGIVATSIDAVKFLKGLLGGKLLQPATMQQMQNWVKDEHNEPVYGLGLYNIRYNGHTGIGHGGGGIGAGCALYHFPAKGVYVFMGTNIGTLVPGPVVDKVGEMKAAILAVLLQ